MVRLPMPPSANVMWRSDFARKRVYVSSRHPREGPVSLTAEFFFKNKRVRVDLDNRLKPLLDVCQRTEYNTGLYVDDAQIMAIHAYKYFDPDQPRVEVTVVAL